VALGLIGAWLLGQTLRPFVFGIATRSAVVFMLVGLATLALGAAAALPSVRRAMRLDVRASM
jgi:hypothetical protein